MVILCGNKEANFRFGIREDVARSQLLELLVSCMLALGVKGLKPKLEVVVSRAPPIFIWSLFITVDAST